MRGLGAGGGATFRSRPPSPAPSSRIITGELFDDRAAFVITIASRLMRLGIFKHRFCYAAKCYLSSPEVLSQFDLQSNLSASLLNELLRSTKRLRVKREQGSVRSPPDPANRHQTCQCDDHGEVNRQRCYDRQPGVVSNKLWRIVPQVSEWPDCDQSTWTYEIRYR
jgi:hypothetical protein